MATGTGEGMVGGGSDGAEFDSGAPESLWTGRLEVDLLNGRGWPVGNVEVVVRIESITVWLENRTLAVMDRDLFREWLGRPHKPFDIDDLLWTVDDDVTCLTIDRSSQYIIPAPVTAQLATLI